LATVFLAAGSTLKTYAGTENTTGWLWGGSNDGAGNNTGVGWASMNDTNPGAGGAVSYGVNIPDAGCSGAGCDLSGYAWSENIGWIDFAPAGPFPAVATGDDYAYAAKRDGDYLRGWARIAGIKTEYEKVPSNSGGWEGWIRLSSDADDPILYGVEIAKMDGTGDSPTFAWSGELGWVDFSGALLVFPPEITSFFALNPVIILDASKCLPQTDTLEWTVADCVAPCSCTASDGWSGNKTIPSGSEDVNVTSSSTYTLTCSNSAGSDEETASIVSGCNNTACNTGNQECETLFSITDDCNECLAPSCVSDNECKTDRSWKEVAP